MLLVEDLQTLAYRPAWELQERIHAEVAGGAAERILLVEHPPVITLGRRPKPDAHLLASAEDLARIGVELVHTDRGGDITFHGVGQIVAYPIIRLNDHGLSVGGYVRALENAVIAALADLGVAGRRIAGAVGIWTGKEDRPAKICAIGVRIRRGVSMHGLALNVETDMKYFNLIVPCGLTGTAVTSLREILGDRTPPMDAVKQILVAALQRQLSAVESAT
jgi:lipoyl(octanoyl) transferase